MGLAWLDFSIIAVVCLSMLIGFFRGFLKELIGLLIWVVAIWSALNYAHTLDPLFGSSIANKTSRMVVEFVIILVTVLIVGGILNLFLGLLLRRSGLSGTDRILGLGFGFGRAIIIISFIMLAIKMTDLPVENYTKSSKLYRKFSPIVNWLNTLMPDVVKKVKGLDLNKKIGLAYDIAKVEIFDVNLVAEEERI